jgi:hypothetical protein
MKRNGAIKVADPKALSNDKIRRRLVELFFTEVQIYGMLDHRNTLPVYGAGEAGDLLPRYGIHREQQGAAILRGTAKRS